MTIISESADGTAIIGPNTKEPSGPGMHIYIEEDAIKKAISCDTLTDALTSIVLWEYHRSLEAIYKKDDRETRFRFLITRVMQRWNTRKLSQG